MKYNYQHGRKDSFDLVRRLLLERGQGVYVEIGCVREWNDMGAGYSTPFFAAIAKETKSEFVSIDSDVEHINIARLILNKYDLRATFHTQDGIEFLQNYKKPIDFLYLDAWDYYGDTKPISAQKHLQAYLAANLAPRALVLIDDVLNESTYEGKGELLIPELLQRGYKCLYKGYQFLFENGAE